MRAALTFLFTIASFVATGCAMPASDINDKGTVVRVLPNGAVESTIPADEFFNTIHKRQTVDLIGATCQSTCSGSPGPGPNQNDCDAITNGLFGTGSNQFSVNPNIVVFIIFGSCQVNFVNLSSDVVVYEDDDWASVASFLSGACNAAHGFSMGQCTFDELPSVFIQVQHS